MVDAKIPQNSRVIDFKRAAAGTDHSTLLILRFSRNYIFKGGLSNISKTICPIDLKLCTHILNGIIYDVAYQFFHPIPHSYIINGLNSFSSREKRIIFFTLLSFVQ